MPVRANPRRVKLHRSYTGGELAALLEVHKNTIWHWQREGLKPIDKGRPALFQGQQVRTFLTDRNARRKRPCPPGTLYCFRCRASQPPALAMVDWIERRPGTGNLQAICGTCDAVMHRAARRADLSAIMPGIAVQIRLA